MDRKLFGIFSGTHLTILGGLAIVAPSALYGAVQVSQVAITDPNTGNRSFVDPGRKVWTYDPIAGYRNSPTNYVDIFFNLFTNSCATDYTVPSGKALVVTAVSGRGIKADSSKTDAYYYLYDGAGCSGPSVTAGGSSDVASPIAADFGSGIVIKSGTLSVLPGNNNGYVYVHGYLIPAGAAPPSAATVATSPSDAAHLMAKKGPAR